MRVQTEVELWCAAGCGMFVVPAVRFTLSNELEYNEHAMCPACDAGSVGEEEGKLAQAARDLEELGDDGEEHDESLGDA